LPRSFLTKLLSNIILCLLASSTTRLAFPEHLLINATQTNVVIRPIRPIGLRNKTEITNDDDDIAATQFVWLSY